MASKKKSKKKNKSAEAQNKGLLGGNLNGIAVALLTTLVTEIVQQVLDRLLHPHGQPAAATADGNFDQGKSDLFMTEAESDDKPAVIAASAVNDRVTQVRPAIQDILKTVQSTVQEATPRLNEAIAVLQASSNNPKQAVATLVRDAVAGTKESLNTAAATAGGDSWVSRALSATQTIVDNVAVADTEEAGKKSKKKKGKKKKGKKSKK